MVVLVNFRSIEVAVLMLLMMAVHCSWVTSNAYSCTENDTVGKHYSKLSKKDTKRRCGCLGQRQIQLTLQKISTRACETEESQNDKSIHELDKQRRRLEVEKEELQVILTSHWSPDQNTEL